MVMVLLLLILMVLSLVLTQFPVTTFINSLLNEFS